MQSRSLLLSTLRKKGACIQQVHLFKERFCEEVQVTEELALSVASLFDWNWAGYKLLSDQARAEYNKICSPAQAEYNKICSPALAEYNKVHDQALVEYDKVHDQALVEYDKICAVTFAKLYINDKREIKYA